MGRETEAASEGHVVASNQAVAPEMIPGQPQPGLSQMNTNFQPVYVKLDGTREETAKEYDKLRLIFVILLAVAGFFALLSVCLVVGYHSEVAAANNASLYTWKTSPNLHQIIMILVVILQGIAINVYRIFPFTINRNIVKLIHFGLHFLVGIAMIGGLLSIIFFKDTLSCPQHFFSQHGWMGLTIIPCFLAQLVGGTISFLVPIWPIEIHAIFMPFHKAIGWLIYVASCITALMAFNNQFLAKIEGTFLTTPQLIIRFAFLFLLFHVTMMLYLAIAPQFKRRQRPVY